MKKNYVRPTMVGERFVADEFVAACGEVITYKFVCDAGGGVKGDVYTKDGTNLTPNNQSFFGSVTNYYCACNKTHDASSTDEFIEGTFVKNNGNDKAGKYVGTWPFGHYEGYESVPVIIWTEGGKDVHCTTELDKKNWGKNKS